MAVMPHALCLSPEPPLHIMQHQRLGILAVASDTGVWSARVVVKMVRPASVGYRSSCCRCQGGRYPKKKDWGLIFFEVTFALGLTVE